LTAPQPSPPGPWLDAINRLASLPNRAALGVAVGFAVLGFFPSLAWPIPVAAAAFSMVAYSHGGKLASEMLRPWRLRRLLAQRAALVDSGADPQLIVTVVRAIERLVGPETLLAPPPRAARDERE
jgi:hypothetical protein